MSISLEQKPVVKRAHKKLYAKSYEAIFRKNGFFTTASLASPPISQN